MEHAEKMAESLILKCCVFIGHNLLWYYALHIAIPSILIDLVAWLVQFHYHKIFHSLLCLALQ
jgi:hypothetical protein